MEAKQNDLYEALHKLMYCSYSTRIKNLVIHHDEKDKWSIHVNYQWDKITDDQSCDSK